MSIYWWGVSLMIYFGDRYFNSSIKCYIKTQKKKNAEYCYVFSICIFSNCAPRQDKKDRRTLDIYPHLEDAWVGASVF